jgi:hypothetical protein
MKNYLYVFLFFLPCALGGCLRKDKPGTQVWMYMKVKDIDNPQTWDTVLTSADFMDLQPDGRFTQDFGRFEYGTWEIKEQRLYLTDQHHKTYIYLIRDMHGTMLSVRLGKGNSTGMFRGRGLPPSSPEKDPFSLVNNQWRIPPVHKENDKEIRLRLLNHCRFLEVYLNWAENAGIDEIEVHDIPTPLKVYANGFGLKHYAGLPAEWKSCFYDEEDCHKADSLIKHAFRTHNIVWPTTDDDVKKLTSGCHQVQQWLQ